VDVEHDVVSMDASHMASSERQPQIQRTSQGSPQRPQSEEGEGIESFFEQLWLVPSRRGRVSQFHPSLFWIRRDLWESRQFGAGDCFPVKRSDVLKPDPKQGNFASDFWGKGVRSSFLEVAQVGMAGRVNRGRSRGRGGRGEDQWDGRGSRFEEEQWNAGQGWWNPNFHQGLFHP
jgi:hypothetical protein